MTAAAIAPSTTPPATTDNSVFFRDGVMAASATKGELSDDTRAVVATEDIVNLLFTNLTIYKSRFRRKNSLLTHLSSTTASWVSSAFAVAATTLPNTARNKRSEPLDSSWKASCFFLPLLHSARNARKEHSYSSFEDELILEDAAITQDNAGAIVPCLRDRRVCTRGVETVREVEEAREIIVIDEGERCYASASQCRLSPLHRSCCENLSSTVKIW